MYVWQHVSTELAFYNDVSAQTLGVLDGAGGPM